MTPYLTAEGLFDLAFVSDPQLSPDGLHYATVVTRIVPGNEDEPPRYRSQVALRSAGGAQWQEFEASYSDSRPRFSRDGKRLGWLATPGRKEPAQLWWRPLSGGEGERLTDEDGGVLSYAWRPGQDQVAFLARDTPPAGGLPVAREIDRLKHKADGKGFLPKEARKLRLLRLGGEPGTVNLPSDLDPEELAWSGDGRWLFITSAESQVERDEAVTRIWRVDPESGELRRLTDAGRVSAFEPNEDGSLVAYLAPANDDGGAGPAGVWLLDVEAGEAALLSGTDSDLAPALGGDSRYGDYPNKPLWLSGDRLLVNHNRQGLSRLATLTTGGRLAELDTGAKHVVTSFSQAAGVVLFTREDSASPGEVYMLGRPGAPLMPGVEPERLTDLNGELARRHGFVRASGPFTPNQESAAAYWRLDPPEARPDRALILQVHGGPHTNVGEGFYFEFQLLLAHGYTVLYGNPRGSSSYGSDFATAILGDYGSVDSEDLLGFVDHALGNHARPDAPVHITGGSYGGFMTNWLVAHSERFRSAVTQRSICNFLSFYGTSDIGYWFGEREIGGKPWLDFERLWRQSPLRLAHRIATPLLILHSEEDLRCPVEQAQQLYTAVKRSGKTETRMLLFPEESHELSRSGRPDRRVRRLQEIISWFEGHA